MSSQIDEKNLKLVGRLLLPFKQFKEVFKSASKHGKFALLLECILFGFGPLALGQIELGLILPILMYALAFAFGFILSGYIGGTILISVITFIVVSLILLAALIALYYITFKMSVNLVKKQLEGEKIFNSYIYNALSFFFSSTLSWFKEFSVQFKAGDKKVKTLLPLSFFSFGIPLIAFGEIVKGLALFLAQALGILYMIARGVSDLINFFTLGNTYNFQAPIVYGAIAMVVLLLIIFFYIVSIRQTLKAANNYNTKRLGENFKKQLYSVIDKNFYITSLFIPVLGAIVFTIIPLLFMIMIAFTNFSNRSDVIGTTGSLGFLEWTGMDAFKRIFADGANLQDLLSVFSWTMIWALLATFTCFFGGLLLAMLINKKVIKCKALFRSLFVVAMAMPQFVSLLVMKAFFYDYGPLQTFLTNIGILDGSSPMLLWETEFTARMLIIFINMWVGIPYYMLLMSGLLINIPKGYYEAAKISGASRFKQFTRITFPNIMFMTAPMLITSFVSNINNFNVIWFLTGGNPANDSVSGSAGKTDILITWLYKLTMQRQDYNFGAAIGIIMFIVTATLSLVVFRNTSSYKNEEEYR